jgi:hypothetical protein
MPSERSDDSAKEKFRAALDRKRGKKHPHEGASASDSKIHQAHDAAATKRQFRRKSG